MYTSVQPFSAGRWQPSGVFRSDRVCRLTETTFICAHHQYLNTYKCIDALFMRELHFSFSIMAARFAGVTVLAMRWLGSVGHNRTQRRAREAFFVHVDDYMYECNVV